jgi:hypothetical protein
LTQRSRCGAVSVHPENGNTKTSERRMCVMKRLSKSLLIGAAALGVLTGAFAQSARSKFCTGIGTTSDWNSAIWGDGNVSTTELILAPGSDFYLFFKVQFQPGYGGATDWAIINLFLDLTRQSGSSPVGANYTTAISGYANSAEWAEDPSQTDPTWSGGGYTQQVRRGVQEIRANSTSPSSSSAASVTPQGVAFKVLVTGGAGGYSNPFVVGYAKFRVLDSAPFGRYELGLNRLAGFDLDGNGSLIGSEGVTVRTNFGTNGNPNSDYGGELCSVTLVVPEPASMIALGSGLVGLLALRRRRQA